MKRYRSKTTKPGERLVHNFYPGPHDDPGQNRSYGDGGFRFWITDEPNPNEHRCYCGWLDGLEHYGTVDYVAAPEDAGDSESSSKQRP